MSHAADQAQRLCTITLPPNSGPAALHVLLLAGSQGLYYVKIRSCEIMLFLRLFRS
jgi:hypothetical protein